MRRFIATLLVSLSLASILLSASVSADANDAIFKACDGNGGSSICQDEAAQKSSGKNPVNGYIHIAADIVAAMTGLAAVIMIIISGFRFVTGGGSPDTVSKARSTLTSAVIGLALVGLAWTIVTFAVDKLIP